MWPKSTSVYRILSVIKGRRSECDVKNRTGLTLHFVVLFATVKPYSETLIHSDSYKRMKVFSNIMKSPFTANYENR